MKIGILVGGFPPEILAGAELQAKQAAEQLAQQGHLVNVFVRSSGFYPSRMEQNGYTVNPRHALPLKGMRFRTSDVYTTDSSGSSLPRMIWDIGVALWDIAHCHPRPEVLLCYQTIVNGLIGVMAQILLRIPAVVSIRGNREYRVSGSMPYQTAVLFVYRNATSIILQTPRMLEDLCAVLQARRKTELSTLVRAKSRVIPNGICLPRLPSRTRAGGSDVLYIGRLIPEKGVADLIGAIKQLPHAELLVVGDGPDRARLKSLADGTSTTFAGRVSHEAIADYLQQARVLVLPSHSGDGLPNVILEAMSWGVPVVATNTAGIPDIVRHGETGYLYEPGDVGKMAAYVSCLLADDELHHRLSVQSLHAVESFSWRSVAPQIEQVLLECLEVCERSI